MINYYHFNQAEVTAAPVMASLGSAILFVLLLIISGIVDHIFKYAFLAGILTGIMSSYYES